MEAALRTLETGRGIERSRALRVLEDLEDSLAGDAAAAVGQRLAAVDTERMTAYVRDRLDQLSRRLFPQGGSPPV